MICEILNYGGKHPDLRERLILLVIGSISVSKCCDDNIGSVSDGFDWDLQMILAMSFSSCW